MAASTKHSARRTGWLPSALPLLGLGSLPHCMAFHIHNFSFLKLRHLPSPHHYCLPSGRRTFQRQKRQTLGVKLTRPAIFVPKHKKDGSHGCSKACSWKPAARRGSSRDLVLDLLSKSSSASEHPRNATEVGRSRRDLRGPQVSEHLDLKPCIVRSLEVFSILLVER